MKTEDTNVARQQRHASWQDDASKLQELSLEVLHLRYELVKTKVASRAERGMYLKAAGQLAAVESELRRISLCLDDAQIHIDGLLNHSAVMQQKLAAEASARYAVETDLAKEQATAAVLRARLAQVEIMLSHFQSFALCRWLAGHQANK